MSVPVQERILVVDDERAIRELVRRLLERAGYACATAGSGTEAEELLAREPFELLLADLQMPGESGLDLIGRVRDLHCDTATIMITGVEDPQLADTALTLGAYGYIVKPFSPTELSIQVLNALRRRRLEIEQRHERMRLEQTVEARTAELRFAINQLERSQDETSRRLASAVEARDHETGEHIERVAEWSARVAERLGLDPERCELLRRASKLHDIGKIGVPDQILLKPGALSSDERRVMQRHAQIGRDILAGSDLQLLDLAATIAWTHHERVDGTGYPRALAADEIPLEGRIVAVVDVFDALTSDRPYRRALPLSEALELLEQGRGTQFDADVLDAFLDALESESQVARIPTEALL